MSAVPKVPLNNGTQIPQVGLGTWGMPPSEIGNIISIAIEKGYRHFDCAYINFNETEIGAALQNKIKSGAVTREELFLTSKLWCSFHEPQEVPKALQQTLDNLQVSYLDLYLMHWPMAIKNTCCPSEEPFANAQGYDHDFTQTWKAMENLVNEGKVKAIGLANFNQNQIQKILDNCTIKPAVLQVEVHLAMQQKELSAFTTSNGIVMEAYAVLGGRSANTNAIKPNDPKLGQIAKKYSCKSQEGGCKTLEQVALRYLIESEFVVLVNSTQENHLELDIALFDFTLLDCDICELAKFDMNMRVVDPEGASKLPNYPFGSDVCCANEQKSTGTPIC